MEDWLLPCLFKYLFNFECPGCGLQRSLLYLAQGRFEESFKLYWGTVPILVLFGATTIQLFFKFRHGLRVLIFLYIVAASVIMSHYIYKIAHQTTA